jgi:hypothetical protein
VWVLGVGDLLEISDKLGSKVAKLGPCWQQVAPKSRQNSAKIAIFLVCQFSWGGFWTLLIFGVVFAARWVVVQSLKTNNIPALLLDIQGSGDSFFNCFG